jgi:hypothetical protein
MLEENQGVMSLGKEAVQNKSKAKSISPGKAAILLG